MSTFPSLIGLYSSAPQCGKTTVASYLTGMGYTSLSFATPIKRMAQVLLTELGYSAEEAHNLLHERKEEKLECVSTTSRHVLQTLGTEFGRGCVHPRVWLMCAERSLSRHLAEGHPVVFDDCRFPDEADFVRRLGGELWRIERPGTERQTEHASEGGLDDYPLFDRRLINDGSLLDLHERVNQLITPTPAAA
jgi:hypothetical protein